MFELLVGEVPLRSRGYPVHDFISRQARRGRKGTNACGGKYIGIQTFFVQAELLPARGIRGLGGGVRHGGEKLVGPEMVGLINLI